MVGLTLGWMAGGYVQSTNYASANEHSTSHAAPPKHATEESPAGEETAGEAPHDNHHDERAAHAAEQLRVSTDAAPWYFDVVAAAIGLFVVAGLLGYTALKNHKPEPEADDDHGHDAHAHAHDAHAHGGGH